MARDIRILIDDELCRTCKRCLAAEACKVKAIMCFDQDEAPFLAIERCYDCHLCVPACPFGAIRMAGENQPPGKVIR
jgi:Fe-S-cluster-containing hydrogenase component 2